MSLNLLKDISNGKPSNFTAVKIRVAEGGGGPDENGETELSVQMKIF